MDHEKKEGSLKHRLSSLKGDDKGQGDQDESAPDKEQELSLLSLIEEDFSEKSDSVYRETIIIHRPVITNDDMWKMKQIESLRNEIGDTFFYGVFLASIGKRYYFKPLKMWEKAYLLQDCIEDEAKFLVRYYRNCIELFIRKGTLWHIVHEEEGVIREGRYITMNRSRRTPDRLCFIVLDILSIDLTH